LALALALLAGVLAAAQLGWTILRLDRPWFSYDSALYALAGRELAETGHLTTPYAYVGTLLPGAEPPFPQIAGHPLLPLLEAPLFALFGPRPWLSLVWPLLAFLCTVVFATSLTWRAGGRLHHAVLAGIALAAMPSMLANATDGLSEMPFTAAWTAALLLLAGYRWKPSSGTLGTLLGIAHLARPVVAPTLPVWVAVVAWGSPPGTRARHVLRLLGGFLPFAAVLFAYKWLTTGSPFTEVGQLMLLTGLSPDFGAHDVARLLHPPSAGAWIAQHPDLFARKLSTNLLDLLPQALSLGGWLPGLGFAWFVLGRGPGERTALRIVVATTFAALVLLAACTLPRAHYLFPMLPAMVALGTVGLANLLARLRLRPRTVTAVLAVVLAWSSLRPLALEWTRRAGPAPGRFTESALRRSGREIARAFGPGTLVTSDLAPWVSWYAGLPTVNLPRRIEDLDELRGDHGLAGVVLTNEWLVHRPEDAEWGRAFEGVGELPGWRSAGRVREGAFEAALWRPAPHEAGVSPPPPRASPAR